MASHARVRSQGSRVRLSRRGGCLLWCIIAGWAAAPGDGAHSEPGGQLFIGRRTDGLGETIKCLIYGMAVAERFGMRFGGMVGGGHESHGINMSAVVTELFGSIELFPMAPPPKALAMAGLHLKDPPELTLLARLETALAAGHRTIFLEDRGISVQRHADKAMKAKGLQEADWLLTPALLSSLRARWHRALGSRLDPGDMKMAARRERPFVAVHVRRGDVSSRNKKHRHRYTGDAWYFDLVDQIRAQVPDCDVHVFSSLEGKYPSASFDGYRQRGMAVHLDTPPLWDWAQMISADVLVLARSAYSHVPALMNRNCVLYQPYWSMPLKGWVRTKKSIPATFWVKTWMNVNITQVSAQRTCLGKVGRRFHDEQ